MLKTLVITYKHFILLVIVITTKHVYYCEHYFVIGGSSVQSEHLETTLIHMRRDSYLLLLLYSLPE